MKIDRICDRVIKFSFYLLFFLVPLILTPLNYELFEFNKMVTVYFLTIVIAGSWLIKMVVQKQIIFCKTPFDLPLLLFLLSQVVSTFFSIDRHVSLFGYYSRFNGGLLSIICYLLLFYALVSNLDGKSVIKILKVSLLSALVVSLYGILEHFGIDKNIWVQDVQNRVFSTLGQPNWLAAYLAILLPITMGFICHSEALAEESHKNLQKQRRSFAALRMTSAKFFFFYLLSFIFYLCLLYTKSRSGLLAFGVTYVVFWLSIFFVRRQNLKHILKSFIVLSAFCFLLSALVGTPWTPSVTNFKFGQQTILPTQPPPTGPALEVGGTESGEIRKIVWRGAIDIARHYPLFGSGVETFAYSYYRFRPASHNLVSEWDFLYNKAHNEYLNYAATTGFVGLGAYLLLIGWFMAWSVRKISSSQLILTLLTGYLSILITNFFGFSVVIVNLYFFLIPALSYLLAIESQPSQSRCVLSDPLPMWNYSDTSVKWAKLMVIFVLLTVGYFLLATSRYWYADTLFNKAYQLDRLSRYQESFELYRQAISLNSNEPFYRDEIAYNSAVLAVAALDEKKTTLAKQLIDNALTQNKIALTTSPYNLSFWKTRTKIYYSLAQANHLSETEITQYNQEALDSLLMAQKLSPTDPKITYNLALVYARLGNNKTAMKILEETVNLKHNYGDARYALALFYHEANRQEEAVSQLKYLLTKISTDSAEAKEKLKEWGYTN